MFDWYVNNQIVFRCQVNYLIIFDKILAKHRFAHLEHTKIFIFESLKSVLFLFFIFHLQLWSFSVWRNCSDAFLKSGLVANRLDCLSVVQGFYFEIFFSQNSSSFIIYWTVVIIFRQSFLVAWRQFPDYSVKFYQWFTIYCDLI